MQAGRQHTAHQPGSEPLAGDIPSASTERRRSDGDVEAAWPLDTRFSWCYYPTMPRGAPSQPNRSIIAGVTVLQEVVAAGAPVGSRELARRLGLEHSKANRILGTLVHMGMLRRTADRRYAPGAGVHVLSAQSLRASGLIQASLAPLR